MDQIYVPSTWRRLGANFIDQVLSLLMYLPFGGVFFKLFFTEEDVFISIFQLIILFFIPVIYDFIFLVLMQATPGKWMLGLKVVPRENPVQPLEVAQCLLRPLTGRLSFFFGWAIYALAFFRYDRTHLCDWVAETRVVQFQPRPERTRLRWFLGLLFVISYAYEGLVSSSHMLQQVQWANNQVNLRALVPESAMDVDFDEGE
ncbi:RDD family protein [Bdellovibrio sp. HCB2-146]|uniref:RDD family protein n=1 Tax=Bdellovibrio sp. HCB2-146 TaxID=3394362 RepID=UPI0039BCD4F7